MQIVRYRRQQHLPEIGQNQLKAFTEELREVAPLVWTEYCIS
jgi:hypothetical protein